MKAPSYYSLMLEIERLSERGRSIANVVFTFSQDRSSAYRNAIFDNDNGGSDEQADIILHELVALYVHLLDRLAFIRLGPKQRNTFIEELVRHLLDLFCHGLDNESIARTWMHVKEVINQRQLEYSAFKALVPQQGESPANTLCWEFGKKLSTTLEIYNPIRSMQVCDLALTDCNVLSELVTDGGVFSG